MFGKTKNLMRKTEIREDHIVTEDDPFCLIEAYRNLKTNISFCVEKKENGDGICIMVTSSAPQEGKSTVAVNLSLALAKSDYKVLLIDCDLRKPRIHKFFKEKNKAGITNYLCGMINEEEAINKSQYENLDLVYCGFTPPNPNELLCGKRFKTFLEEASKKYDYIIIDTPPLSSVADALVIGPQVDGTIVVVAHKKTSKVTLKYCVEQLEFAKIKLLGFIFNEYALDDYNQYKYNNKYKYAEK